MHPLLKLFDEQLHGDIYSLEVYYSSIVDWSIQIGFKLSDEVIVHVQHCDIDYAFAKAETEFKDWLLENKGGY